MKIAFIGDLMFGNANFRPISEQKNIINPLTKIKKRLEKFDFIIGNLECVLKNNDLSKESNSILSPIKYLDYFNKKKLILALANNHIMDFGLKVFNKNKKILRRKKIKIFGLKKKNYIIVKKNSQRLAIINFSIIEDSKKNKAYSYKFKKKEIKNLVDYLKKKKKVNYIICYIHWGSENSKKINIHQYKIAEVLTKMDIDLLTGCHSHIIQNSHIINNKPVIFGLGDFISNYQNKSKLLSVTAKDKLLLKGEIYKTNKNKVIKYIKNIKIIFSKIKILSNYEAFLWRNVLRLKILKIILINFYKYDKNFYKFLVSRFKYFFTNFHLELKNPQHEYNKWNANRKKYVSK